MPRFVPLLAVLVLLGPGAGALDHRFDSLFGSLKPGPVVTLSEAQVADLLTLASQRHWNLFDLLDEATLDLKDRGVRIRVEGAALRTLSRTFRLGDSRTDTLLPLDVLVSVSLGTRGSSDADVEILLLRPVSGYLELGDFFLDSRYGFRTAGTKVLEGAFGLKVKNGLFTWDVAKIARVPDPTGKNDPNFIAIHLSNFLRPKRWQIDPVRVLSAPVPKP